MSKIDKLKNHLTAGYSISGLEAIQLFGLYRLSGAVHVLRRRGMKIETLMCESSSGEKYARYFVAQSTLNEERQ